MHLTVCRNVGPATYSLQRGGTIAEGAYNPVTGFNLDHVAGSIFDSIKLGWRAYDLALDVVTGSPGGTVQLRDFEITVLEVSDACE